jgi:hypothetical protein
MNREKAKLILQNYRPGGQDRDDPQFAQALALTEQDPALKQWFQDQQRFDQNLTATLQNIPIPATLQADILTQIRDARTTPQNETAPHTLWQTLHNILHYPILDFRKTTPPPPRWRSRPIMAIAAGLALLAILGIYWTARPTTFNTFCQQITEEAWAAYPHIQFRSTNIAEIRTWLTSHGADPQFNLPPTLQNTPIHGCTLIDWHGRKIPVLCIAEHTTHLHLIIVDDPNVTDAPPLNQPELIDYGLVRTASWSAKTSNKDRIYVLTGMNTRNFVKKFRQSRQWNLPS